MRQQFHLQEQPTFGHHDVTLVSSIYPTDRRTDQNKKGKMKPKCDIIEVLVVKAVFVLM